MFLLPPEVAALSKITDASSRLAMGGVLCEETDDNTKSRFVATDGRCLAIIDAVTKDPKEFPIPPGFNTEKNGAKTGIIDSNDVQRLVKSLPKDKVRKSNPVLGYVAIQFSDEDETHHVGTTAQAATADLGMAGVQQITCINGRFPRYRDVLPNEEPVVSVELNVDLLQKLLDAAQEVDGFVRIDMFGGTKPVRLTSASHSKHREFTGLIMPVTR